MKFLLPIVIFFSIYFYPTQVEEELNADVEAYVTFVRQYSNLKTDYSKLNSIQKMMKWKSRILNAHNLLELSAEQKVACKGIAAFLTPYLFENPNFIVLDSLRNEIVRIFSKEKGAYIFTSMTQNKQEYYWLTTPMQDQTKPSNKDTGKKGDSVLPQKRLPSGGKEDPPCNCSTVSDFCSSIRDCKDSDCLKTDGGCGLLWAYDCNGRCQ